MQPKILVDYLTFTVGARCYLEQWGEDVDGLEYLADTDVLTSLCHDWHFGNLQLMARKGWYGYMYAYVGGGITLAWGGCDTVLIQLSGQGCRLYETLYPDLDWLTLIQQIRAYKVHNISRLDIACDTFGQLSMDNLIKYTFAGRYVSRFRDYLVSIGTKERSIIFGAPSSRMRLRIYDKTMERLRAGRSAEDVPDNWIRLEYQLRDAAADSFISAWMDTGSISAAYFGIMSNQLRYVKSKDEDNPQRSVMTTWWSKFLGYADKIPMAYKGGLDYNLDNLTKYVFDQAGSSIRTWLEIMDYDMDKFARMVNNRNLNIRQQLLLDQLNVEVSSN